MNFNILDEITVKPIHIDNKVMEIAFIDFCSVCIGREDMREDFAEKTGYSLSRIVSSSPIDNLISVCTGHEKEMIMAFIEYVAIYHWGVEDD